MRRANGTPAIIITLIAVSVLFIGSNASARSSLQTAMHVVGLPVGLPPVAADSTDLQNGAAGSDIQKPASKSSKSNDGHSTASTSAGNQPVSGKQSSYAQSLSGSVDVDPSTIAPACVQGTQTYTVQSALLTIAQAPQHSGNVFWNWETRIDSGTNTGQSPVNTSAHAIPVSKGAKQIQISNDDPTQPLLNAASNTDYAYSFRLDITSPFIADSPWVSVPQASSTTCQ